MLKEYIVRIFIVINIFIFISYANSQDAGVTLITSPKGGHNLGYNNKVTILVKNYGTESINNIPVSYSINSGIFYRDTINTTIEPQQTFSFSFRQKADLSQYGVYQIAARTNLPNDINPINDEVITSISNLKKFYCASGSYYGRYENIGAVKIGNVFNYRNDSCIYRYINYMDSLYEFAPYGMESKYKYHPIRLVNDSTYTIDITQIQGRDAKAFNSCWINVYIDFDGNDTLNYYTERVFGKNTLSYQMTISGKFKVPNNAKRGLTLMRIVMQEGGDAISAQPCINFNYGETVDFAVMIEPKINEDAGIVSIIRPSEKEGEGQKIPVIAKIRNYGKQTINEMDISYRIDYNEQSNFHWTGNLEPNKETDVTLPMLTVPVFNSRITAYTSLANDSNNFNDLYFKSFYGVPRIDAGASFIVAPYENDCYSSQQSLILRVKNYGSQPLDFSKNPLIANFNITGVNPKMFTDTLKTSVLNVNDSLDFVFKQTYDMSSEGSYFFNAFAFVIGDELSTNDMITPVSFNIFSTISQYPYEENFENFTPGIPGKVSGGWIRNPELKPGESNSYRWQVNRGGTYTDATGPESDHTTGNKSGKYMIIEADSAGSPAILQSPCIDLSILEKPMLSFWYYLYGKNISNFHIDIYDGAVWHNDIFNFNTQQQNSEFELWKQAIVDLSDYTTVVKIRFVGERGNGNQGDIAIDDIRIYEPDNVNAGIHTINNPINLWGKSGNKQTLTVSVRNYGNSVINSFNISYKSDNEIVNETWSGTLQPNGLLNYTFKKQFTIPKFEEKENKNISLKVWIKAENDTDISNDTLKTLFTSVATNSPYFNDFENVTDISILKDANNWNQDMYSLYSLNTIYKWWIKKGPVNYETGPQIDHTLKSIYGNYLLAYAQQSYPEDYAFLNSPLFDISEFEHPKLSFWYHMFGTDVKQIEVDIFSNGKWTNIKQIKGQIQTVQNQSWKQMIIDLSQYDGIIKLRFKGIYGNSEHSAIAIDDISVYDSKPIDLATQNIKFPTIYHITAGSTQKVSLTIENRGTTDVKGFAAGYIINNNKPVLENVNLNVNKNLSVSYDFKTNFTVPQGEFTVKCFIETYGDTNQVNDTIVKKFFGIPVLNLPYTDDFEEERMWYSSDTLIHWQFGKPDLNFIPDILSTSQPEPENVWVTNLNGSFKPGVEYSLYSPKFDFSNISVNATLSFWQFMNESSYIDNARIMYSTENQPEWVVLGYVGDPNGTNWYNYVYNGKPCWNYINNNKKWFKSSYNLNQFRFKSGVRFKFSFTTSPQSTLPEKSIYGWAIDNFNITLPKINSDAGFTSITNPTEYVNSGEEIKLKGIVKNFGNLDIQDIPVAYQIDNLASIFDTIKQTIKPDSSVEFSFKHKLIGKNNFRICLYTKLNNDNNTFNDKICFRSFNDIGVYWINKPIAKAKRDTNTKISVLIKNYGIATIDSASLTYTINGIPESKETWKGKLKPGEMVEYTFEKSLQPSTSAFNLCAYSMMLNDANASNNQVCKNISLLTGIDEIGNFDNNLLINIYPNPASEYANILFNMKRDDIAEISIHNLIGIKIYSSKLHYAKGLNLEKINLRGLQKGIYFVSIRNAEIMQVKEIFVY